MKNKLRRLSTGQQLYQLERLLTFKIPHLSSLELREPLAPKYLEIKSELLKTH